MKLICFQKKPLQRIGWKNKKMRHGRICEGRYCSGKFPFLRPKFFKTKACFSTWLCRKWWLFALPNYFQKHQRKLGIAIARGINHRRRIIQIKQRKTKQALHSRSVHHTLQGRKDLFFHEKKCYRFHYRFNFIEFLVNFYQNKVDFQSLEIDWYQIYFVFSSPIFKIIPKTLM